ncbi:MAG: TIM barrel protein [Phycisphaeraceae bacterium]|nr:TIM barrel protein [Phycisphaeraceae bacterium]
MPLKQSFCYPMFESPTTDYEALCAAAAKIGYPAVEWWFRDDRFVERVAIAHRHGLVVASICGHQSLTCGLNNPAEHDRIVAELTESINLAVQHGIPNLICFSGNRCPGQTQEQAIDACACGLSRIAPRAEKTGVMLNMELLNSKVDHPGYQADHAAWGVAVCQKVASSNVKLLYDIYHMQIMEGDVIRTIRESLKWIGHFHTAGNPGRNDLDDQQELHYPAICRAINQAGYDRYLGHEFKPKANPLAALNAAFAWCTEPATATKTSRLEKTR